MSKAKDKPLLDITAQRSDLLASLTDAAHIARDKIVLPGAGHMCIECQDKGSASWWATDYDMWRGGVLTIESAIEPGLALLPVTKAVAMVKSCPDGLIRLVFSSAGVTLTAGGFVAKIPGLSPDAFPQRPTLPPLESMITLPVRTFATLIQRVEPICTANQSKYFMRGALFQIKDGEILCVSTNGHQLAKSAAPFQHDAEDVRTILPKGAMLELQSMLDGAKAVSYAPLDNKHLFRVDTDVLVAKSIDDKFPAWEVILPGAHETRVVFPRVQVLDILKRVMLASDVESRRLRCDITSATLTIAASSMKGGEAVEGIPIDQEGPDVALGLNGLYLMQFLETATTERVSWEIKNADAVFVFKPEEPAPEVGGADFVYVQAPMVKP